MTRARDIASGIDYITGIDAGEVLPHIIPGVLYPAVSGKLLDGSTSHSGNYGTAQADGYSYYYTDIKGSKPIKDPRIGGHFGSQRHKFSSIQTLEQETTTHGQTIYSIDGREWCRMSWGQPDNNKMYNSSHGNYIQFDTGHSDNTDWIEVTGYFSSLNILCNTDNNQEFFNVTLDGTANSSRNDLAVTATNPLGGRYVSASSVCNVVFDSAPTLGIHTVKIGNDDGYMGISGIEFIAQDTTSTATKSQIQIPSQNVVSYGKKFTVSGTPHYNPFATKGDGSASTIPNNTTGDSVATGWAGSTSAYWDSSLDTATSLGLGAWESGGNFYRPVNGGRVIKWVDSSGTIKTSVNMMPPEAHAIESTSASLGDSPATGTHNWSTVYQPQFGNKITGSDLITNGTFSSNTTGWTAEGNTTIASTAGGQSGNCLTITRGTSTTQTVKQTYASFVVGKWYKMSAYIKQGTDTGGTMYLRAEGAAVTHYPNSPTFTSTGSFVKHSLVFKAETTSYEVMLRGTVDTDGQTILIDTVTLHEIEQPESLSEVAKQFHMREFGNGAANQGNNTSGTLQDFSMANAVDDWAYVMDDGLTSASSTHHRFSSITEGLHRNSGSGKFYHTFIGTGIGRRTGTAVSDGKYHTFAQNLPYGTHIFAHIMDAGGENSKWYVDGIEVYDNSSGSSTWHNVGESLHIHQPKKPPIPEDAVVLADYMLMADFVVQTVGTVGHLSKGVRYVSASRDHFYDAGGGGTLQTVEMDIATGPFGLRSGNNHALESGETGTVKLPYFGTDFLMNHYANRVGTITENLNSDVGTSAAISTSAYEGITKHTGNNLGVNEIKNHMTDGQNDDQIWISQTQIATPIHTSSHYQTFETPFLHELVGGDRNMEQHNLIVTPDGKSWDQLTRDTSYIGPSTQLSCTMDNAHVSSGNPVIFDEFRGENSSRPCFNKNIAIAYDRMIILENGIYQVDLEFYNNQPDAVVYITKNTTDANVLYGTLLRADSSDDTTYGRLIWEMKRGDFIYVKVDSGGSNTFHGTNSGMQQYNITKIN